MSFEQLEEALDEVRKCHEELIKLLEFKEIDAYHDEVKGLVRLYYPKLENKCVFVLKKCADFTEQDGHSERLDYIKETAFLVYGICLGVEL